RLAQLPGRAWLSCAGSGAAGGRSAAGDPLDRPSASRAGQPVRRTSRAAPFAGRQPLAADRCLALGMSGPLDLGTDRTTVPMERLITPVLAVLVTAVALASLATGSSDVAVFSGLWHWLLGETDASAIVMGEIRLPRTLLALGVGAALGLAGAALQGLLRNPLADPSLTGASQGAALGA